VYMDYGYRMWKTYIRDVKMYDPDMVAGNQQNFRNYIYWLKRLGLIREVATDDPTTKPYQEEGSPVGPRRGKQDWSTVWYEVVPEKEALAYLYLLTTKGDPKGHRISDEIFDTWYLGVKVGTKIQVDPLKLAWANPRRVMYTESYNANLETMKKPPKRKRRRLEKMPVGELRKQIARIEKAILMRGGKVGRPLLPEEEVEEILEKREEKTRERAERKRVRRLPTKDIATEEIKRLTIAAILEFGDVDRDVARQKMIKAISKQYQLTGMEESLAVDRGVDEAFRVANEPDKDKVQEYIYYLIADAWNLLLRIAFVRTGERKPLTDKAKWKIAQDLKLDRTTVTIINDLQILHGLDKLRIEQLIFRSKKMVIEHAGLKEPKE
ncbi:MAG: hypothetical protein U9R75_01875, partial [Candidatus Thermoplasmatota archaeon]|nr:hypothetical protein [Candidatus Thermoplasmatota archaeon]